MQPELTQQIRNLVNIEGLTDMSIYLLQSDIDEKAGVMNTNIDKVSK